MALPRSNGCLLLRSTNGRGADSTSSQRCKMHLSTLSQPALRSLSVEGWDRGQDRVRDSLWLRDHDHVGALGIGDRGPGALGHRTHDVRTGRLVAARNQGLGGARPSRRAPRTVWRTPTRRQGAGWRPSRRSARRAGRRRRHHGIFQDRSRTLRPSPRPIPSGTGAGPRLCSGRCLSRCFQHLPGFRPGPEAKAAT